MYISEVEVSPDPSDLISRQSRSPRRECHEGVRRTRQSKVTDRLRKLSFAWRLQVLNDFRH